MTGAKVTYFNAFIIQNSTFKIAANPYLCGLLVDTVTGEKGVAEPLLVKTACQLSTIQLIN